MGFGLNTWVPLNSVRLITHITLLLKTPQLTASTEKTGASKDITIGEIQLTGHNEQSKEIQGCYVYLPA